MFFISNLKDEEVTGEGESPEAMQVYKLATRMGFREDVFVVALMFSKEIPTLHG